MGFQHLSHERLQEIGAAGGRETSRRGKNPGGLIPPHQAKKNGRKGGKAGSREKKRDAALKQAAAKRLRRLQEEVGDGKSDVECGAR